MAETYDEIMARKPYTLTKEEARNPAKYQEAKAAAEKAGDPRGVIIVDPGAPDQTQDKSGLDVVYLKDAIVARREAVRDPREYQRLRAEADKSRRTFVTVEALDAIPDENLQSRVKAAIDGTDPGRLRATADPLAS